MPCFVPEVGKAIPFAVIDPAYLNVPDLEIQADSARIQSILHKHWRIAMVWVPKP